MFVLLWIGVLAGHPRVRIQTESFLSRAYSSTTFDTENIPFVNSYHGGAAIHVEDPILEKPENTLNIMSCTFIDMVAGGVSGQAKDAVLGGGAVFLKNCGLYAMQDEFIRCVAGWGRGGAILALGSVNSQELRAYLTIYFCNFTECACEPKDWREHGGGGAIACEKDECIITDSIFTDCYCGEELSGGAIMTNFPWPVKGLGPLTLTKCQFYNCSSVQEGVLWIGGNKLEVQWCTFKDCVSESKTAIMNLANEYVYNEMTDVIISGSSFINCTGGPDTALMSVIGNVISLTNDVFDLRLGNDKYCAILFGQRSTNLPVLVLNCTFCNNGYQLGEKTNDGFKVPGGFINVTRPLTNVTFFNCSFDKIEKAGLGAGLNIEIASQSSTPGALSVWFCNFTDLRATEMGAGIMSGYAYTTNSGDVLDVQGCRFVNCVANGGGGGVCIEHESSGVSFYGCFFIANQATQENEGQSLKFLRGSSEQKLYPIAVNLTIFQDHNKGPIIKVFPVWLDNKMGETKLEIVSCGFANNHLGASQFGVIDSYTATVEWKSCIFFDCSCDNGLFGLNFTADGGLRTTYVFSKCTFETIRTKNTGVFSSINQEMAGGVGLSECTFTDCEAEQASAVLQSSTCAVMYLWSCNFTNCRSATGKAVLDVTCLTLSVNGLWFVDCSDRLMNAEAASAKVAVLAIEPKWRTETAFSLKITGGADAETSTIEDVIVNVSTVDQASNPASPFSISIANDVEVDFLNCCFSCQDPSATLPAPYLTLQVDGKAEFSGVCFDHEKDAALRVTGKGEIEYEGDEEDFFVNCFCSARTFTEIVTEPPAADTGDPGLSGGAIAGIVIVLLLLIAVAVVLLFLFVIRRRKRNTSSDDRPTRDEDEPEVTITTMTDDQANPDWGVVTEDNPVFAAQSQDVGEDPFKQVYEERQFV